MKQYLSSRQGVTLAVWALSAMLWARTSSAQEPLGGGEFRPPQSICLAEPDRAVIQARLTRNLDQLRERGEISQLPAALAVKLGWPLAGSGLSTPGVHGISNFVDHNPAVPNQLQDYFCGTRTYDLSSGYNHKGIDMFSWPFGWLRMDQSSVTIVAAAAGTIIGKDDGNSDRSCAISNASWNAVYVRHDDGSVAWYGHMKKGSPTSKAIGQRVTAGEALGVVGSSGSSTGPHLHFELYDANGSLTDAYSGSCNTMATSSSWTSQRSYYDSAINELATHSVPPVFPTCPTAETPNYQSTFDPGAKAYFASYFRDQLAGQTATYSILKPDGSVWQTWTHASTAAHYAASYWYWSYTLPTTPLGTWKFKAQYQAQTVEQSFVLGSLYVQPVWHGFFAVDTLETPYIGDFNGDNRTDIITFARQNPSALGDVYVALSTGTAFGTNTKWHDFFAISTDETVVIGDYDGDGKDDIATWLGKASRQVYVARSLGSGMTAEAVWVNSIGSNSTDYLAAGDANGDGKEDLIMFARAEGKVYVALSDGTKFGTPTVWHPFFAVSTYERPRVADVNGDGKDDIVTFATDSPSAFGDVYVALSNGTAFRDKNGLQNSDKWHDFFAIRQTEEIRIGDLNADLKDDFFTFLPPPFAQAYSVLSTGSSLASNVLWREAVAPQLGQGDNVYVGDVNADGKSDIIIFAQKEGKVYVSLAP